MRSEVKRGVGGQYSHTAVITQTELLHALIEPFLKAETPI